LKAPASLIISNVIMSKLSPIPVSRERELGFAIKDTARLLRTYADQRARGLRMTHAQWAVMAGVYRCQGVKQSELAEALDLAPITVARLLDKLVDAGWVERRDDAHDRRANRLYLTEKATPMLLELGALSEAIMRKALAGLEEGEIDGLIRGLGQIKANLKSELNPGA
jgi:MarR family transcriptional regulator, transcriptional regulator for hemolysin